MPSSRFATRARRGAALLVIAAGAACGSPTDGADDAAPGGSTPGTQPRLLDSLPRRLTGVERTAATAGSEFSFALFREVNRRKARTNVFVSPLSAAVALAMTAQGAGGTTETGMRTTLGFANQSLAEMGDGYRGLVNLILGIDSSVTAKSANAIWYRRGLPVQPSFVDVTQRVFGAQVTAADFADVTGTVGAINGWAKAQTNGKIDKVIETVTPDQVMFLLNALYFKGAWRDKFDARQTTPNAFTNAAGQTTQVPTMHRNARMRWAQGAGFEAVDLPYGNGAFSMTVLLPDAGRTADALATTLDAAAWNQLVTQFNESLVDLSLPKFSFAYEDTWNDVLTTLGMGVAFTDRADFSRMVVGGGVKIDFVKQNAFVDVNEEGTEAAAVTSIGVVATSAPIARAFRVDRPFVFAIREKFSGAILFVGKVDSL